VPARKYNPTSYTPHFYIKIFSARSRSQGKGLVPLSYPSVRPSVRLSVCLSAFISAAPNGSISVALYIGVFYENLSRYSKLGYNCTQIWGILHENPEGVLLLPSTLNRQKSALFVCYGIRLSG